MGKHVTTCAFHGQARHGLLEKFNITGAPEASDSDATIQYSSSYGQAPLPFRTPACSLL
jgi:hypothetical protein